MNASPAFQFYAGDWIKSRSVRLMDAEQRGWYIQLLAEAWDGNPQCMLPKDDATLQILAGVSAESQSQQTFNARWATVKGMFSDRGQYLANERQLECLASQTHNREMAVKAGLQSAKNRESKRKEIQKALRQIVTESNGRSTDAQRNVNGKSTLLLLSPTPTPVSDTHTKVCDFDLFWQVYPKKKAKDSALKAWNKRKDRPDITTIIKAVNDQSASIEWKKDGGQYIPHPATWINAGRWSDVTDEISSQKPTWNGCINV